ncbi:hypothetical protein KUCAC02_027573, partial [Chaenocephalus aceratus]
CKDSQHTGSPKHPDLPSLSDPIVPLLLLTGGQGETSKRTLFGRSHDDEVTWSGFTSVDGGCQRLFDGWLSLKWV